jgi:cathepsin K
MHAYTYMLKAANGRAVALLVLFCLALTGGLLLSADAMASDSWERSYTFVDNRTPEEMQNLYGFRLPDNYEELFAEKLKLYKAPADLPSNFDWRDLDGVTSVKDQGSCGSCWAFAAVGQIESHIKIKYGYDMNLSEQQTIFCNPHGSDCGGGWASSVYYVSENNGINREAAEPYSGTNSGTCNQTDYLSFGFVADWNYVDNGVTQIKTALLEGPVCSALDASYPFDELGAGCYDEPGSSWTNHLVMIIGWDDRLCDGNGGWICKNSWGSDHGEYGYFTIQYGASLIGSSTTQIQLEDAPVDITFLTPLPDAPMVAGQPTDITWSTSGAACNLVDIWVSYNGEAYTECIAQNVPNTGSYTWDVINNATTNLQFCIVADGDTRNGFGLSKYPLTIIGYKTRYVATSGSNTPPYDSPATAAHTLADAVYACTGFDSVMVAQGDYLESFLVDGTIRIFGGWSTDFSTRNPELYPTRIKGNNSVARFSATGGDFPGIDGVTFYDCQGALYTNPEYGRHGGAILCIDASPTISNCVFENCKSDISAGYGSGGAIMAWEGSPVIENCVFEGNTAQQGGAVALYGTANAQLRHNIYTMNANTDSMVSTSLGAALYIDGGTVDLDDESFTANGGTYAGGGLYAANALVVGRDLTFTDNRSVNIGGGAYVLSGDMDLVGGAFIGNTSGGGGGGGLYATGSVTNLQNIIFADNTTAGMGGGLAAQSVSTSDIRHCVVYGNSAGIMFGGAFCQGDAMILRNNVIMANTGGGIGGGLTSLDMDYNNVWGNTGGDIIGLTAGSHGLSQDPLFVDAAGGDFGLGLHSPCVDTADPDPTCLDLDGTCADMGLHGGPMGVTPAPVPVTGLTAISIGGTEYRLTWDASTDPEASQYVIYSCPESGFVPDAAAMVDLVAHPVTQFDGTLSKASSYTVAVISNDGYMSGLAAPVVLPDGTSGIGDLPGKLAISGVVPNPFNPSTRVSFDLPARTHVRLAVYDMRGREVRTLINTPMAPGSHQVSWNGRSNAGAIQAAGVYLMRLATDKGQVTQKIVMAK